MAASDYHRERERQNLAEEMMDLVLLTKGAAALFQLIGKEPSFDLESLNKKMTGVDKATRTADQLNKLWGVVRELQEAKSALEQDVKSLGESEERLKEQLDEADSRNSALRDEIEQMHRALEEGKKLDERKLQQMADELKHVQSQNEALQKDLKELETVKAENKELRQRLKTLEEEMKHDNLKRQLDKLYWVNKELIAQIRERDIQTDRLKEDFKELQNEDRLKDQQIEELDAKKREQTFNKDLVAMTKKELEDTIRRQEREGEESKEEIEKLKKDISDLKKQFDSKKSDLNKQRQLTSSASDVKNEVNNLQKEIEALKKELKRKEAELGEERSKRKSLEQQQEKIQEEIKEKNRQLKSELNEIDDASSKMKMDLKAKGNEYDDLKRTLKAKSEEIEALRKKVHDLESAAMAKPTSSANPVSSTAFTPSHRLANRMTSQQKPTQLPSFSPSANSKSNNNTFQEYMDADFSETYTVNSNEPETNLSLDLEPSYSKNKDKYKVPPGTIFPLTSWNDRPNYPTDFVNPTKLNRFGSEPNPNHQSNDSSRLKGSFETPPSRDPKDPKFTNRNPKISAENDTTNRYLTQTAIPGLSQSNLGFDSTPFNSTSKYHPSISKPDFSHLDSRTSADLKTRDSKSRSHAPPSSRSPFANGLSSKR